MSTEPVEHEVAVHNLPAIAAASPGMKPAWSIESGDLDANLISLLAGEGVGRHVNREVDVLVVGVSGDGSIEVDGTWHSLPATHLVMIPKGVERATRCDGDHFAYLTCHRRRAALNPLVPSTSRATGEEDRS